MEIEGSATSVAETVTVPVPVHPNQPPRRSERLTLFLICVVQFILAAVLGGLILGSCLMSVELAMKSIPGTVLWQIASAFAIPILFAILVGLFECAYPPYPEKRWRHVTLYQFTWFLALLIGVSVSLVFGIIGSVDTVQLQDRENALRPVYVTPTNTSSAVLFNLSRPGTALLFEPYLFDEQIEYGDGVSNDNVLHRVYRIGNFTTVVVTAPLYEPRFGWMWLERVEPVVQNSVNRAVFDLRYRFPNTTLQVGAVGLSGSRRAIKYDEDKKRIKDTRVMLYVFAWVIPGVTLVATVGCALGGTD